jgi:hypothetical protein
MMSCDVYIYDDTMNPESSGSIEILETDRWGVKIDLQTSKAQGPNEYGAKLKLPAPAKPINVWVDDNSGHYAPVSLGLLNGMLPTRLDVTLYPVPSTKGGHGTGGGGGGGGGLSSHFWPGLSKPAPQTPHDIADFIRERVASRRWTENEGTAVKNLFEAVVRALDCPRKNLKLQALLIKWCEKLRRLGIEVLEKSPPPGSNFGQGGHQMGGGAQQGRTMGPMSY